MIIPYKALNPVVDPTAFIAPDAWITGDTRVASEVSIFFGAVLRGDILPIIIGRRTNIQDHSMIHTSKGRIPTEIGEECTIGHRATLHGCKIGNRVLVGMGSIILDEALIEDECIIGAGSLITEHKHFPSHSLILGSPARVVRKLSSDEIAFLTESATRYVEVGKTYKDLFSRNFGAITKA